MTQPRLPLTIRAGALLRALPDFPGRDTLLLLCARRARRFNTLARGCYAGGLVFEGNPAIDGNAIDLFFLRYTRPALAPVLDAVLRTGSVFADVGANQGMYAFYGARLVGAGGEVHAFEPVPRTMARLRRNLELNPFPSVRCVEMAMGAAKGTITLHLPQDASGLASRYRVSEEAHLQVPVTTLDACFEDRRPPDLIKIDVEGMEIEVLRGAARLLSGPAPPVLIFETENRQLAAAGSSYREILDFLARTGGYGAWSLTRSGLRLEGTSSETPGSLNTLATRLNFDAHDRVTRALMKTRFPSDQNA